MMKNKINFKTALMRRDSDSSSFKAIDGKKPLVRGSSTAPPTPMVSEQPRMNRRRTNNDEKLHLHTAKISRVLDDSFDRPQSNGSEPVQGYGHAGGAHTVVSVEGTSPLAIETFIDGLKLNPAVASTLKQILCPISYKIVNSRYISTENNGQLHLQSFVIGVALMSFLVIIRPFLMIYFEGWIVLIKRLVKHLFGWVVVGAVVSYVLNYKKDDAMEATTSKVGDDVEVRDNRFKAMEYTVKNSRSASPVKKSKGPNSSRRSVTRRSSDVVYDLGGDSEKLIMKMTERQQAIERAKQEVDKSRPNERTNYEKFMDIALRKDQQNEQYNKFVSDNRDLINNKKDLLFGK